MIHFVCGVAVGYVFKDVLYQIISVVEETVENQRHHRT